MQMRARGMRLTELTQRCVLPAGMVERHKHTNNLIDDKTAVASDNVDKCHLHDG